MSDIIAERTNSDGISIKMSIASRGKKIENINNKCKWLRCHKYY